MRRLSKPVIWLGDSRRGLMIVTGSATVLHLARNEFGPAATTILLFALSAVVAYGRRDRAVAIATFGCNSARTLG